MNNTEHAKLAPGATFTLHILGGDIAATYEVESVGTHYVIARKIKHDGRPCVRPGGPVRIAIGRIACVRPAPSA